MFIFLLNNRTIQKYLYMSASISILGGYEMDLLTTIVVILLVLWLLGVAVGTVGSLIHILLVIAIIVVLVRIIQGRRPIP